MFKKLNLILLLTLAGGDVLRAATYYVSKTGSDSASGSAGAPWLTIGHAATMASAGDSVNIGDGTYSESVTFSRSGTSGSPITFTGSASVVVRSMVLSGNYVIIKGMSINPQSTDGLSAVSFTGTGSVVTNCDITGAYDTAAALFTASSANCLLVNCRLHDMHDVDVFHLWGVGNVIRGNEVTGNDNPGYNNVMHADVLQIYGDNNDQSIGNIFEGNYVHDCQTQCFTMSQDGRSNIHDNIFRNNIIVNIQNTSFVGEWRTKFYNNLFINVGIGPATALWFYAPNAAWDPTGSEVVNNVFVGYSITTDTPENSFLIDHNYFGTAAYGSTTTHGTSPKNGGNLQFVNSGAGNYHSQPPSVLIDAGTTLASFAADRDGISRPQGSAWDIGPYEYALSGAGTNPVIQVFPATLAFGPIAAGASVTNTLTVQNTGAGTLSGTATVAASSTSYLKLISDGSYSLGAGQSKIVAVRYTPSGSATDNGSITCSGGGGAQVSVTGSLLAVLSELSFPSYAGVITAPFATNRGGYVAQSIATGVSDGGKAFYAFRITNSGNYTVSVSVNAPSDAANSLYVNIDSTPTDPIMIWDIPVTAGFSNQSVSWRGNGTDTANQYVPAVFSLSAGVHELIIVGREAGAELGQITIAPYLGGRSTPPSPPQNLRIAATSL